VGVGKNREILLSKPTDVALHPDGRVYVSDLWKGILVFNPNGTLINIFRIEYEITATVFDSKGNLVAVTPSDTYLLHTFTARGQEVMAFGLQQETSEALREAFGQGFLAIDKTDNVYLSYAFPYKIAKYNPEGQAVLTFARELETPLTPPTIYKGKDGNITQVFRQQFSYDVDVGGDGLIYNLIRTRGAKGGNLIDIFSSTGEYLQTLYLISNAEKFCLYADKIALLTASRFPSIEIYQIQAIRR
jgi:DNA-binding beta-propeller fold protein YncE